MSAVTSMRAALLPAPGTPLRVVELELAAPGPGEVLVRLHSSGVCQDDRFNAPSHVRQLLTNQSVMLDVQGGHLTLGRWQDVALLELDGPRPDRQIVVKIMRD